MSTSTPNDKTDKSGQTHVTRGRKDEPRLPHERDESSDAQQAPASPNDDVGQQAHDDVERGLVDTDEAKRAHVVQGDKAAPQRRRG